MSERRENERAEREREREREKGTCRKNDGDELRSTRSLTLSFCAPLCFALSLSVCLYGLKASRRG